MEYEVKLCHDCGETKGLDNFILRREGYYTSYCRSCARDRVKRWRKANPEKAAEQKRRWAEKYRESGKSAERLRKSRTESPGRVKVTNRAWGERNRERIYLANRAGRQVRRAIASGELIRPECCDECGRNGAIEAAHSDYLKPLSVRWLCRSCHRKWDAKQPKTCSGVCGI